MCGMCVPVRSSMCVWSCVCVCVLSLHLRVCGSVNVCDIMVGACVIYCVCVCVESSFEVGEHERRFAI